MMILSRLFTGRRRRDSRHFLLGDCCERVKSVDEGDRDNKLTENYCIFLNFPYTIIKQGRFESQM